MPHECKKLRCQSAPPDILSGLPDNVIDVILMRLPLRDAVRTSILSTKWRYNWCRLPQLILDRTLWATTKKFVSPSVKFTNIIFHILTLHEGPITKFTLSIPNLGNCPKFDNLMYVLSKNGIQDLTLQLPKDSPYKLPSSFFTCLQIRNLTLRYCIIHPPPAFKGFDRLTSLELCQVTISSELLENLISNSPFLDHLVLQSDIILDHIQINAPKLRFIDFAGSMKSISFRNVPLLAELLLWDPGSPENAGKCDIAEFFESFPALERIGLNYLIVKVLATGEADQVPRRLASPLNSLRRLFLYDISLGDLDEVSCVLCLLRSSPYLQDLKITVYGGAVNKIPEVESLEVVDFSDVTFNHLTTVKLEGITGTKLELQLIKLLLAKCLVLVTMKIEPRLHDASPQTSLQVVATNLKVVAQVSKYRRASSQAEVVYDIDCIAQSLGSQDL